MRKAIVSLVSLLLTCVAFASWAESVEVEVFYPEQETEKLTLELSGTVLAAQDAQLASLETGLVKAIFAEAGDKVTAGQALLSLDDTLAKLRLSQVEANHISAQVQQQEAQRQFDEVASLAKSKVVADSILAERKASLASANAELSNTQAQVALQKEIVRRHTLTAPFDGIIARRNVDLGEWIGQQDQIFQLVSNKSLRLIVDLPQEHLKAFSKMSQVMAIVIPDVMPDKQYQLPLTNIVTVSQPLSRTVKIRIDLPDNTELIPGMSARARFSLPAENEALTWIPKTALKRHPDGGNSAFTVNADRVKRHKINLIKSEMDRVAVTGLPSNSAVVISGTELLKDNQLVTVVATKGFR